MRSQVINGNESRGAHAEKRKWFITEANTSVDGQNNFNRGESWEWEVKLLKELKSEVPTLSGASAKIILKRERALGSQIIKENEIRGAYAERRKWFITDASTSVEERRGKCPTK